MILPTKRLPADRCLLSIGAQILTRTTDPMTVSKLWEEVRRMRDEHSGTAPISFDWFTTTLAFLYAINAIELDRGRIRKAAKK